MSGLHTVYLVILGVCTLASGFFSGSETALIAINRERVHQLSETSRRGERVEQLVGDPERLLSTLLVANNLVNILGTAVATTLFIDLLGETLGPWIATGAVTAVILVVGEITPKTLAARFPEVFSLAVAPTIWHLSRFLRPVAHLFTWITRKLLRILRISGGDSASAVTDDDVRALARLGERDGEIEAAEREIIDALFGLAQRPVREVMTPRVAITTLLEPVSIGAVRDAVIATGHSRFPVTKSEDLDDLVGVLYVKDIFRMGYEPDHETIARSLRKPHFVPESTAVLQILHQMRVRRMGVSFVLDEHGSIEGIVTIKDLIAELVGELQDEYDPGAPSIVRIGPNQWMSDGRLPVEDLAEVLQLEIPTGPYATTGGLFLNAAGRIPDEGDFVEVDDLRFTVVRMDRRRVDRLRIDTNTGVR